MKKFKWKLQRLLDVKSRQEELKKTQLLAIIQNIAAIRQNLLMRKAKLRVLFADLASQKASHRLPQQQLCLTAVAYADEQIEKLKQQLAELEKQRAAVMAEVLGLRRFRKSLEKLRSIAKEEYDLELKKIEQNFLDETTGIAFARELLAGSRMHETINTV